MFYQNFTNVKKITIFAQMNTSIRHIEYLLKCHDCVIVPHFGGFVVQHVPAYYDAEQGLYFPPRKYVVFNPDLNHNDGILASSIARKDSIRFEAASQIISDEVSEIKGKIRETGSITLGRVGRMDYKHGKYIFTANENFVVAPQLFGLKSLKVKTVDSTEEDTQKTPAKQPFNFKRKMLYAGRVAASIAILIACGLIFSTPITVDESEVKLASLTLPEVKMPEKQVAADGTLFIMCPDAEESMAIDTTFGNNTSAINNSDPYYLVVASLATRSQAEQFIASVKGYDGELQIVESITKFRVIAATGESPEDVMNYKKANLATCFPNAWPCHR